MASRPPDAIADGVDLSQRIRDGAALAATVLPGGVHAVEFVVRYTTSNTTNNPGKQLTDADILTCRRNKLSLVLVAEKTARRALAGYAAGRADAAEAASFVKSKGMPPDTPIHGAIDFDAAGPDVEAYVRGWRDALGVSRVGMYGGRKPLRRLLDAGLITYAWQTFAWSDGIWTPGITAAQWANGQPAAGNDVDYDSACAPDYGQLGPGWTSTDRDIVMTEVDLTPAAVEAVRKAIMGSRVDNVAPPGVGQQVTLEQAARMDYFRTGGLANQMWPALLGADNKSGLVGQILAQSQANGAGITDLKAAVAGISTSAAGVTAEQIAATYRAAAATLDPPTTG